MRWSVRGVAEETVERARALSASYGSIGEVVDEAVRRLYEDHDEPHCTLDDDMKGRMVAHVQEIERMTAWLKGYLGMRHP